MSSEALEFTERQLLCHILAHYKHQVNRYRDMFRDTDAPSTIKRQVQEHQAVVHLIEGYLEEMNRDLS